jgi:hypothetical protein
MRFDYYKTSNATVLIGNVDLPQARAVSDGLIPRDKAELLPPDWVMGDRLDFDCPHCAVRFTREDARDRHVKVQHQARHQASSC